MGEAYKAGTTYRNNKDYKKALAAYEEAGKLAKNPQQKASAEFMSGIVICEDKQYEKGIARLRKALAAAQTDGQRVSCQFHIAYYLGIMRKYEEAIDEMRKVQEFGKEGIKHTYISRADGYIGNYLFALKRYEEAIDAVRDACRSEDNITAFMALNITYRSHKELKNNEGMMTAVDGLLNLNEPRPYMFFMSRQYAFERIWTWTQNIVPTGFITRLSVTTHCMKRRKNLLSGDFSKTAVSSIWKAFPSPT